MKIYIALREIYYEGSEILGVSFSKEKLEKIINPDVEEQTCGTVHEYIQEYDLI